MLAVLPGQLDANQGNAYGSVERHLDGGGDVESPLDGFEDSDDWEIVAGVCPLTPHRGARQARCTNTNGPVLNGRRTHGRSLPVRVDSDL